MCTCLSNTCSAFWTFIYDILRSIPYLALPGLALSFVGCIICISEKSSVEESFELLANMGVASSALAFVDYFYLIFIIMVLVNIGALLQAFMATGKTREICFGGGDSWCGCCAWILVGPIFQTVVFICLVISFLVAFALVIGLMPALPFVVLVGASCREGQQAIQNLVDTLSVLGNAGTLTVNAVNDVCAITSGFEQGTYVLIAGAVMIVLGQVWMLERSSQYRLRVWYEPLLSKEYQKADYDSMGSAQTSA